ncbi:MAG: twin-arginine translocase TatA/TatE family subunit [Sphingomicrobium sp.]
MGSFSLIHWIILAIVLMLVFGGNRFSSMMGDVAKGLKSFKQGMADDDDAKSTRPGDPRTPPPHQLPPQQQPPYQAPPIDLTAQPRPADPVSPPPHPPVPPSDDSAR